MPDVAAPLQRPDTDFADRLYTPTAQEAEEYKRLYMTCENARKTALGEKTQTRRIIDDQIPKCVDRIQVAGGCHPAQSMYEHCDGSTVYVVEQKYHLGEIRLVTTPHWRAHTGTEKDRIWDPATGVVRFSGSTPGGPNAICVPNEEGWHPPKAHDWHPVHASFLMPAWASRIAVEMEAVWVERVQEIGKSDAFAEGLDPNKIHPYSPDEPVEVAVKHKFANLWNSIHGEEAWGRNDWVRCVEYSLITD